LRFGTEKLCDNFYLISRELIVDFLSFLSFRHIHRLSNFQSVPKEMTVVSEEIDPFRIFFLIISPFPLFLT
jgi:hypothetical protein